MMSDNPRVVAADVMFTWDGVPWRLQRGQVIDVQPGSALERAIGADLLVPLSGPQPAAPAPRSAEPEQPAQAAEDTAPAQRKTRSAAKTDEAAAGTEGDEAT